MTSSNLDLYYGSLTPEKGQGEEAFWGFPVFQEALLQEDMA